MLFILTMEPLQRMFATASDMGLLSPLPRTGMKHRLSIFADDVVVFLKPDEEEQATCSAILEMFGVASELRMNLQKTSALPIRCSNSKKLRIHGMLGCSVGSFPCKYLSLSICLRKPAAARLQGLVEHLTSYLPTWKAVAMPTSG